MAILKTVTAVKDNQKFEMIFNEDLTGGIVKNAKTVDIIFDGGEKSMTTPKDAEEAIEKMKTAGFEVTVK